jgi:hypothetical protein
LLRQASPTTRFADEVASIGTHIANITDVLYWRWPGLASGAAGIGTSVCAAAAAAAGHHIGRPVRVIGRHSTQYSHAVRWKLHCADPYVWQYRQCVTCARRNRLGLCIPQRRVPTPRTVRARQTETRSRIRNRLPDKGAPA